MTYQSILAICISKVQRIMCEMTFQFLYKITPEDRVTKMNGAPNWVAKT